MFSLTPHGRRWLASGVIALAFNLGLTERAAAHDVPEQIVLHAFVKPEGERLHLLVRLPLILLLDLNLPKQGAGYLDLTHIDEALGEAATAAAEQIIVFENDRVLVFQKSTARISLPSDKSFSNYRDALSHIEGPRLPVHTTIFWNQGFLDVHLEYPIVSDRSDFSLRILASGLGRSVKTIVRFVPAKGPVRAYELVGDIGRVALDPRWHQAAWTFVQSGFHHVLQGIDHLLFLLCLVIPIRSLRRLVLVVTSFTLAHSITLIAAARALVPSGEWFPSLVETLIAASILYMAIENVAGARLSHRWILAFAFGLVHGFGFSFAFRESLQFAGAHLLLSLFSFNLGIELGQILVIALLVPVLTLFSRRVMAERIGTILLSVIVAHTAWHWMIERASELRRHAIPVPDITTLSMLGGGCALLLLVVGSQRLLAHRWRIDFAREKGDGKEGFTQGVSRKAGF